MLFGRVRINFEVLKYLVDVVWCNRKWRVFVKFIWDIIFSGRYFIISVEILLYSFDRGGNVRKCLERDFVIRMEVELLNVNIYVCF